MITTIDKAGRLAVPKRVEAGRVEIESVPLAVTLERHGSLVVAVPQSEQPVLKASEVTETTARLRAGESLTSTPE